MAFINRRAMRQSVRLRGLRQGLLLTAGALLVVSCGSGAPVSSTKLTGAELSVLYDGGLAGSSAADVNNATELLTQRCMQSKGLVYYPIILSAADLTSSGSLVGVPQSNIGLGAREADGYGMYSGAVRAITASSGKQGGQSGSDQEDRYVGSLSESTQGRYLSMLSGPESSRISISLPGGGTTTAPSGGCQGTAERQIYGSVTNYVLGLTGASLLTNNLESSVASDPAYSGLISNWSACMNRSGYNYESPEKLWNTLYERIYKTPTLAMRNLEIKTAVADYKCATAVHLVPTITGLEARHAEYLSSTLLSGLASITQIETTALNNAKSLHLSS
jgi:hypothetical protein